MGTDLILPHKWMLRAYDKKVVFVKGFSERPEHVIMKALLWALYLPVYPNLTVEVGVGDRYKPDVVALDDEGKPVLWAEAGQVSMEKIRSLVRRYRSTHFVIAKWATRLDPLIALVGDALDSSTRCAPFDLIYFGSDSAQRFIDAEGNVRVRLEDLDWVRFNEGGSAVRYIPEPPRERKA
ncbi:MAG TPA: hypothetical protein VHP83_05690 [Aggregatilineaceae bacterium]|nr:hypothetical protein [Aggregatilineaceae bacterium]